MINSNLKFWIDSNQVHSTIRPLKDLEIVQTWLDKSETLHHVSQNESKRRPQFRLNTGKTPDVLFKDVANKQIDQQYLIGKPVLSADDKTYTIFSVLNNSVSSLAG